jgi:hypothetical protein
MTKPVPRPVTDDECRAILAEYLRKCRKAVSDCFDYSSHPQFPSTIDIPFRLCGARLIKTSLDVMKVIETAKSQPGTATAEVAGAPDESRPDAALVSPAEEPLLEKIEN